MAQGNRTIPLLTRYREILEKNPSSKVFAPLAEIHRKLGQVDKAFQVLKKGIKLNPTYVPGHLSLAACYSDIGKEEMAYNILRPFVSENLDNHLLLKLFASVCCKLGHFDEALEAYKYLLFLHPKNKHYQNQVAELERGLENGKINDRVEQDASVFEKIATDDSPKSRNESPRSLDIFPLDDEKRLDEGEDEWVQIDFSKTNEKASSLGSTTDEDDEFDSWKMTKSEDFGKALEVEHEEENLLLHGSQKLTSISDESQAKSTKEAVVEQMKKANKNEDSFPLVTHTLVDLYCAQGHFDKAKEVLEKLLALNPDDKKSLEKLSFVLQSSNESSENENDEGRERLMSLYEKAHLHGKSDIKGILTQKYQKFLEILKKRHKNRPNPVS